MSRTRLPAFVALAVCLLPATCFADIVQVLPFNLQITNSTATNLSPSIATVMLDFDQFNPNLGTLTGIAYRILQSTETQSLAVRGSRSANGLFSVTSVGSSSGIGTILQGGSSVNLVTFLDPVTASCSTPLAGGRLCSATTNDSRGVTGAYAFSDPTGYLGFGTIPVVLSLSAGRTAPIGLGASVVRAAGIDAAWTGSIELTYTFTPTPEPSSWMMGLAGCALCLIGMARIRRRGNRRS